MYVQNYYFSFLNLQNVLLTVIVFHWYILNKQRSRRIYFRPVYVPPPMLNKKKKRSLLQNTYIWCYIFALPLRFLKLFGASFYLSGLSCLRCWICLIYFCTFLFKRVWNYMMCLCLLFSCVSVRGCSGSHLSLTLSMSIPR